MNKNNPREIVKDEKVRKEMMNLINIYNEAFAVCAGKAKIHCDMKKSYDFSAFTPLPSTIFDCYLVETSKKEDAKLSYLCFNQIDGKKCEEYCRIYCLLILKRIGYNLLAGIHKD